MDTVLLIPKVKSLIPEIFNILKKGSDDARAAAAQTMDEVRKAMQIDYFNDAALIKQQTEKYKK